MKLPLTAILSSFDVYTVFQKLADYQTKLIAPKSFNRILTNSRKESIKLHTYIYLWVT